MGFVEAAFSAQQGVAVVGGVPGVAKFVAKLFPVPVEGFELRKQILEMPQVLGSAAFEAVTCGGSHL